MTHGYKYIFILIIILTLITTSPTYCSLQKRQAPDPPPLPGPAPSTPVKNPTPLPGPTPSTPKEPVKNPTPLPGPTPSTPKEPVENPKNPPPPPGPAPSTPKEPVKNPKNPPPPPGPTPTPEDPVINPDNPPPPPGPCLDCIVKCCTPYSNCRNVPNSNLNLCEDALKKCNIDCNAGDCKGIDFYYNCNSPKTVPSSSIKPPSPVKTPIITCSSSGDPKCFPPGIAPIITTITKEGVETPTQVPNNIKLTTTITTLTSYFAGYTTTNSLGSSTSILPSTLYIVKSIAITKPTEPAINTVASDSTTILYNFNIYGLWDVTLSLAVIIATFIFMIST